MPFLIDWEAVEALQFLEAVGPGRALLEHLTHAQLVVVGNRGRPAVTAAVLGSTSLNMLHHSTVPVIVCHPGPDRHQP